MEQGKLNVFRASAGSGKTFELTAQYVSLLLAREQALPSGILAVTFTQKATQEMKTRILEHLYDIAHCDTTTTPDCFLAKVMHETGQTADTLRRRAEGALHTILHAYDDFYVQTIDSFLQRLLRSLAHELGLPAGFQVDLNDKEAIHSAVDRLMHELPEHKALLDWVTRFTMENMEDTGSWNVVNKVKNLAEQITKEAFSKDSDRLADKLDNKTVGEYQRRLRRLREATIQSLQGKVVKLRSMYGDGSRFSRGNNVANYLAALCGDAPQKVKPGNTVLKYIADPAGWVRKNDPQRAVALEEATRLRPRLAAVEEAREDAAFTINSCDISLKQLGALRLLGEIDRLVTTLNDESGRFLLGRTPLLFDRLVGDEDTSFIYERAGVQFRHIMIDEFQDTSTLQWHTFRRLVAESLARGHNSMVVGDVKQSIYRWRNGDWETLENIERAYRPEQLAVTTLQTNHRSDRTIVAFNNAFFTAALSHPLFAEGNSAQEQDELLHIYSDVEQQPTTGKGEGYVRISVSDKDGIFPGYEEDEMPVDMLLDDVVRQITLLHDEHHVAYRDMAVLVRTKTEAVRLINYASLNHPSLPFVSSEAFRLEASPAVQTVIATLRYLLHSSDTAAQIYLLHRYYTLVRGEQPEWETLIRDRDALMPETLQRELSTLMRLPLYERCERIIALLDLGAMPDQQDYLFCFLDGVKAFLQSERSDTKLFLTHWDEKLYKQTIPSAVADGVGLLTIHSSKGLAFHTVLLPFTTWKLCEDSTLRKPNLLWCQPAAAPYSDMPLLPMTVNSPMLESIYREDYMREKFRQRVENLNLLYVAFTRAKHNLLVWSDTSVKDAASRVGELVRAFALSDGKEPPFVWESGKPGGSSDDTKTDQEKTNPLRTKPDVATVTMTRSEWRAEFRQSTAAMAFMSEPDEEEALQQQYIDRGKLLHYILEFTPTADDAPAAVRRAVQEGLLPASDEQRTTKFIASRVSQGQAAGWFDGTWTLFRECTILKRTPAGTLLRRRPDRVMQRGAETHVVDFKFGKPKAEHAHQVEEYMDLLRSMGKPGVKGFVWYVLQNSIIRL